jgi:hypothetical protein
MATRVRVNFSTQVPADKSLEVPPSETLSGLITKIRQLDNIGANLGMEFFMKGKLLTQDDHVNSLVPEGLISYNVTSSEWKGTIRNISFLLYCVNKRTAELVVWEEENYEKKRDLYERLAAKNDKWKKRVSKSANLASVRC